jgi:hypothetical protein
MIVKPNETTVKARIVSLERDASASGATLSIEVQENETADPDQDFVRPTAGQTLEVHAADVAGLCSGDLIEAKLALAGGPFGSRVLLRSAHKTT